MDDALFNVRFTSDMYTVMFKDKVSGSLGYGRSSYDFQEERSSLEAQVRFHFTEERRAQRKHGLDLTISSGPPLKSPLNQKIDSFTYFS